MNDFTSQLTICGGLLLLLAWTLAGGRGGAGGRLHELSFARARLILPFALLYLALLLIGHYWL